MAVYVMSDLHGNYEGFMSILEQIHFSEADELYVDGDIVDRGRGGIKILQYMMMQPNIYPIIGNHEYALMQVLDFVTQEITEDAISKIDEKTLKNIIEYQNIGGQITLDEFYKLSKVSNAEKLRTVVRNFFCRINYLLGAIIGLIKE